MAPADKKIAIVLKGDSLERHRGVAHHDPERRGGRPVAVLHDVGRWCHRRIVHRRGADAVVRRRRARRRGERRQPRLPRLLLLLPASRDAGAGASAVHRRQADLPTARGRIDDRVQFAGVRPDRPHGHDQAPGVRAPAHPRHVRVAGRWSRHGGAGSRPSRRPDRLDVPHVVDRQRRAHSRPDDRLVDAARSVDAPRRLRRRRTRRPSTPWWCGSSRESRRPRRPSTSSTATTTRSVCHRRAKERGGIQPVAVATANGAARAPTSPWVTK